MPYRLISQQDPSATLRTYYSKLRIKPFEINDTINVFSTFPAVILFGLRQFIYTFTTAYLKDASWIIVVTPVW
ncbi:hypothetical protein PbJCM13498_01140 [Prolixibacter bellariivorans]|uniref:Uncharacterized protein n=1 Tax=Prolixibacter bellariivorans TaxID=314319 RepID=A0A5M4AUP0_9BACT|nr:hypothetical protein PbJCM13498_01140 [Prolixibacter bellariivorans]